MRPIATTRSATGIPTGRLAVWWVIASEIVIFGGLLASYLMHRLGHPEFGTAEYAGATATWIGAFNTFVLLTSSFSAVKAHEAAEAGNGPLAAQRLLYTAGGGLVFVLVKSYEWYTEISHGYTITKNAFWSFYYVAAGIHASHVIGGMIIMLILYSDVKKNKELQRVELIGNYWHFVDLVWIFLFPLLYIAK
jgi:heme/copper-type cytochrome/quinol oxidase subunit 3